VSRAAEVADWVPDPWDDPDDLYEFEGERPRKKRRILKIATLAAASLLVVAVLVGGGVVLWLTRQINPPGDPGERVNVTIDRGDTLYTLSKRLERQGIITNAKVFRWYVSHKNGLTPTPGYYTVRKRDNLGNILKVLRTSPAQTFDKVTFPEGFTLDQVAKRLSSKVTRLSSVKFLQAASGGGVRSVFQPDGVTSMEGLVFPDTYQVAGNEDETKVLQRLVRQMERVGLREGLDKAQDKVGHSPYEVLIVASLIEREAKLDVDRAKIARVIYNRLDAEKELEIDASLYYGHDASEPFDSLRNLESPYNLYKVKGLPPTPIASPGAASIHAALYPAADPPQSSCPADPKGKKVVACHYLYYVLIDKDGHHAFAATLEEHNKNVAKAKAAGVIP
jgi:UPF0755 protein